MKRRRRYLPVPGHKLGFMPKPDEIARMLMNVLHHQHHDLPEGVTGKCWEWMGPPDKDGYGHIKLRGKKLRVHRVSYAVFNKDSGEGLHIDHLCCHRRCINPAHLVAKEVDTHMTESINRRWENYRIATGAVTPPGEEQGGAVCDVPF